MYFTSLVKFIPKYSFWCINWVLKTERVTQTEEVWGYCRDGDIKEQRVLKTPELIWCDPSMQSEEAVAGAETAIGKDFAMLNLTWGLHSWSYGFSTPSFHFFFVLQKEFMAKKYPFPYDLGKTHGYLFTCDKARQSFWTNRCLKMFSWATCIHWSIKTKCFINQL